LDGDWSRLWAAVCSLHGVSASRKETTAWQLGAKTGAGTVGPLWVKVRTSLCQVFMIKASGGSPRLKGRKPGSSSFNRERAED
jgi:hypothetical protein